MDIPTIIKIIEPAITNDIDSSKNNIDNNTPLIGIMTANKDARVLPNFDDE